MVVHSMIRCRLPGTTSSTLVTVDTRKASHTVSKRITRYANELGEAFRPLVRRYWVTASYGLAAAYVLADTVDKTAKAEKQEQAKADYKRSRVVYIAADTVIWQTLASIVIPGLTINRICAFTLCSLCKFTKLPTSTRKWTTTAVGLGSIPFIVKPIDTFVDLMLDRIFRPFFAD